MFRTSRRTFLAASVSLAALSPSARAQSSDALAAAFANPPDAAKPRVWWHWMNGNVTPEGIRADLEWMARVGIGGVQNFDASLRTPVLVEHPVTYLTPEWRRVFRDAVARADRLGLEFTIASSPGWSESGGPWVRPEQAMKKLVWSETKIDGGERFNAKLPQPPSTPGPFGNISAGAWGLQESAEAAARLYRDQAVIACRASRTDVDLNDENPTITSSAGEIDAALLSDGDLVTPVRLSFGAESTTSIQFSFDRPRTARALSVGVLVPAFGPITLPGPKGRLEASDDGGNFRTLAEISSKTIGHATIAFPAARARMFRVSFDVDRSPPLITSGIYAPAATAHEITKLVLHGGARIDAIEEKAGFTIAEQPREPVESDRSSAIGRGDVIDLTGRMQSDGVLDWTPPRGRWVVLRFGYSLTGRRNHPASEAGTGLEVDKLNREHVKAYADAYLGEYEYTLGAELIGRRGLRYMLTDSYEAGPANWTDGMLEKFQARRGYDLRPWLPALTGRVIDSVEESERFLWDFRQTLGELIADEHYGQLSASLKERGMGRYGESHESGRAFIGDGMQAKKGADVPMAAMWIDSAERPTSSYDPDAREAASVAHIYGQNLVAAEIAYRLGAALYFCAGEFETNRRSLAGDGGQSLCHSHFGAPALGSARTWNWPQPFRSMVHPPGDLGRAGGRVDIVSGAIFAPVAAGPVHRRHRLFIRRRLKHHCFVRPCAAANSGGLWLRLCQCRRAVARVQCARRRADDALGHELSRAGA